MLKYGLVIARRHLQCLEALSVLGLRIHAPVHPLYLLPVLRGRSGSNVHETSFATASNERL